MRARASRTPPSGRSANARRACIRGYNADETGLASLVRALRLAVLVDGGDEEHVARLDERAIAVVDAVMDDPLLDPVGEPARVEAVLKLAALLVIQAHRHIVAHP